MPLTFRRRRSKPVDAAGRGTVAIAIKGGLGNQLLQWSLGQGLAAHGFHVVHDAGLLAPDVALGITSLVGEDGWTGAPVEAVLLKRKTGQAPEQPPWPVVTQGSFTFDEGLLARVEQTVAHEGSCLVEGYWPSTRYWYGQDAEITDVVRTWGTRHLTAQGVEQLHAIANDQRAYAVHVRRGDYVTNPNASAHHGNLDVDYYQRAIGEARARGAERFLYFSDDLEWASEHLLADGDELVSHDVASSPIGEVVLMAAAGGRIVANSTFSWWGGVLSQPNTVTIAPENWFAGTPRDHSDYVPADWIRVPSF